ncbi:hypothetical protein LPJ66_004773, partial [Kickxella alabastrina]
MGNQLSFTVSESELQRQIVGETMPLMVDPRGKADAIMIIIFSIIYLLNFLAMLYLLWNRNYPPLKSKNPILMAFVMMVLLIWSVGDIQINGHIPLANTGFDNCKAFGVWMRILIGVCGMLSLVALRAYGLYRVFFLNRPYHSLALYLPFAIYWVCIIVYGIVIQVLKPSKTTEYIQELDVCEFHSGFRASVFALLWVSLFIVVVVHWVIRNIKSSFNESREMMVTCTIMFFVLLFQTIVNYARPLYPLNVRLRIVATALDLFANNVLWWLIMAVPLYNCLFNRQLYLNHWINKLRRDGLQKEYDMGSNPYAADNNATSTSYNRQSTLLITGAGGNKGGSVFYAMVDDSYERNTTVSGSTTHSGFSQSFGTSAFANENIPMEILSGLPNTNIAHRDVPARARPISTQPDSLPQDVDQWNGPTTDLNCYDITQEITHVKTPPLFPRNVVLAPLSLVAAHNRTLDDCNS